MVGGKADFLCRLVNWQFIRCLAGGTGSLVGIPAGKSQDCSVGFREMTLLYTGFILSVIFFFLPSSLKKNVQMIIYQAGCLTKVQNMVLDQGETQTVKLGGRKGWAGRHSLFFILRINSINQRCLSLNVLAIISSYHLCVVYLTLSVCIKYILYIITIHRDI